MSQQIRPRLASHSLDLPNHCDICNRARSSGNHQACSRARQTRQSAYWKSYMANVEAKRATQTVRRQGTSGPGGRP
ncbi:MAG: hypothetical protein PBV00_19670 [Pseudomonas asiatica]